MLLAPDAPAWAQSDFSMPGTSPMDFNTTQQARLNAHIAGLVLKKTAAENAGGSTRRTSATNRATLTYTPTAELKQQVADELVNRLARNNPAGAKQLAEQMKRHDFNKIYEDILSGTGLHNYDVADALAMYTIAGYIIANNLQTEPRDAQYKAVRAQFAHAVAQTPSYQSFTARARVGEETKIKLVALHAGWQSARREGTLRPYSDDVATAFQRQSGMNLRSLQLSNAGLLSR